MGMPGPVAVLFLAALVIATPFCWAYDKAKSKCSQLFGKSKVMEPAQPPAGAEKQADKDVKDPK
jgi:hypothetical protein